ncbi:hypothetical protein MAR_025785 [Mya arenaria]|uniref:Uncharacterized protein n=1 Tax=Mya arenaria TaxID=6604 RepID=A0ABY7EQS5_MYAAR|nr:hypothetical protein MAR_025785 [Mya arenaria]
MAQSGPSTISMEPAAGQQSSDTSMHQLDKSSLFETPPEVTMEKGSPTEAIINYLQRIEHNINHMDNWLNALDNLDEKVNREFVRRQREQLENSDYFLHEQFPPEIAARRRAQIPALKTAKRLGKRAWLSYDILYVDGKPLTNGDATLKSSAGATGSGRPGVTDVPPAQQLFSEENYTLPYLPAKEEDGVNIMQEHTKILVEPQTVEK